MTEKRDEEKGKKYRLIPNLNAAFVGGPRNITERAGAQARVCAVNRRSLARRREIPEGPNIGGLVSVI